MTLKVDAKFEEKQVCSFKTDNNLVNFEPITLKSQKFALWFVPSVKSMQCLIEKSREKLSFMTLESGAQFEEKPTRGSQNNLRNFTNFHQSAWKLKLKIGTFMGYLYPK